LSVSCTISARPSKPRRISVAALASHTRASDGSSIIGAMPAHAARRRLVDSKPHRPAKIDLDRA